MSLLASDWTVLDKSDGVLAEFGARVMELTRPSRLVTERRQDQRTPISQLIELIPIDETAIRVTGEPICVVGKHLAARGLDFFHTEVLPFKRAIVAFNSSWGLDEHFVINLSWCRFLRPGWYDSGGRFTHIVQPVEYHSGGDGLGI